MHFVYILRCRDGSYYVGSTQDVATRLRVHQSGKGPAFTATRLPVELVYQESFTTLEEAIRRERQLKGWSRAKKQALIAGDRQRLHDLAVSRQSRHKSPDQIDEAAMTSLRIVGDVHAQIAADDLCSSRARPYLELIAGAAHSVQIGDMGDGEAYARLAAEVDAHRHRFFPGNHDHYDCLPPHCLGDFGAICLGDVTFFFVRGAESTDRAKLVRLGEQLGKTLWFQSEELNEEQMRRAEADYLKARPKIMLSHDAPTDIARLVWQHARRLSPPDPEAIFRPSRTNDFLARLSQQHSPRLWIFGHHHRDWRHCEGETAFVCLGELSFIDIDVNGNPCASTTTSR